LVCKCSVDEVFTSKEQQRAKRAKSQLVYEQKKKQEQQRLNDSTKLDSSTAEEESLDEGSISPDERMESVARAASSTPKSVRKRPRNNVVTPALATTLDRTKLSDRNAAFVITATAESHGHDLDDLNVSRSSIRRIRTTA
jgi:hypothetical protein